MLEKIRRDHRRIWLVIWGFILVFIVAIAVAVFWANKTSAPSIAHISAFASKSQNPKPKTISSNVLSFGDDTLTTGQWPAS
jgi:flagellar basal body-associated protein FliL